MSALEPLTIRSGQGDYTVEFVDDVPAIAERIAATKDARLAVDANVARLYAAPLGPAMKAMPATTVDATEDEKSLAGVERLALWLQKTDATKRTHLVCAGGGIVQDISTLAAHLYYRGIPWTLVPTTLLSMSDSCIGAKCAINLGSFKNQLGAFYAPRHVLVCTRFVETLADLDVASGYGEILKLMLTGSQEHFERFRAAVSEDGLRGPKLPRLLRESLEVKKRIIEKDEYEADLRRILNYGHTFGHSLESITRHAVPHGLAVAWGMDLVNFVAFRRGLLAERTFREIHELVATHLRAKPPAKIDAKALIAGARRDKKVADGQINLILLEKPGKLAIVKTPFDAALEAQVVEYVERHDAFAG